MQTKYIVDISHHQKSADIDWPTFAKSVELLFIRVQYGSTRPDEEYDNHVANAIKYDIPFYSYAFPRFISVDDARIEANDAVQRQHEKSLGMVIDIETEYYDKKPSGITKLPKDVRLDGIKAFVAELRAQGVKRVGAYIGHNVYKSWGIDGITDLFDFIWIPRYGANDGKQHEKPDFPCDLWQYTSAGRVAGYIGNLDLSVLIGDKPIEWFTDSTEQMPKPKPKPAATERLLRKGDRGDDVKTLQKALNAKGFDCGAADGIFGPKTEAAVKAFQKAAHIAVDGIVGPQTRKALATAKPKSKYPLPSGVYRKGDKGSAVKQIQTALNAANFKCGAVDGIFGAKTEDAVKRFQSVYLPHEVDGVYGPHTKAALEKVLR